MLRRLLVVAALSCLASPATAGAAAGEAGYAFAHPRLLTQQLIWGLVHAADLLATACHDDADAGKAIADAHAEWRNRYRERIDSAYRELSNYYFASDDAPAGQLGVALHLTGQLDQRPDEIAAACASFVQAIVTPRYDLDMFYALRRDAARVERADAVRRQVAECTGKLAAEPAAALSAKFADWQRDNELIEKVARSRLVALKGDRPEDRLWRHDTGGAAAPPPVACEQLGGRLAEPAYALRDVFGDENR